MRTVLACLWFDICVPPSANRQYACAMAFCPCLLHYMKRNIHVDCLSMFVVGDMCPTICKPVNTHAQWRFVLVFAVDKAQYKCGPS